MLTELPKLFGKTFAIGFLLPAVAIAVVALFILERFGIPTAAPTMIKNNDVFKISMLALVIWLFAIALMALNYAIIRFLEGYGRLNPFRVLLCRRKAKFNELQETVAAAKARIGAAYAVESAPDQNDLDKAGAAMERLAEEYPDQEKWVLPTRFGNAIRAFEVYPRVVYGLDGIPGWDRLLAVIPKEFRDSIEETKSLMDFWVNLWFGALLSVILYSGVAIYKRATCDLWIPAVALLFTLFAAWAARSLASNWGMLIKSAFDVYRGELCTKLGLEAPRSIAHERAMWQLASQTMVFRSNEAADRLTQYRKLDTK